MKAAATAIDRRREIIFSALLVACLVETTRKDSVKGRGRRNSRWKARGSADESGRSCPREKCFARPKQKW